MQQVQLCLEERCGKSLKKLWERLSKEVPGLVNSVGIKWHIPEEIDIHHLKKLRKKLYAKADNNNLVRATDKGHRKSPLQRAIETVNSWLEKLKRYTKDIHICGGRNSYGKTGHDATFMHVKEDHMRNGQLKPGYNVNVATSEEFISGNYISADRNDVHTLNPLFLEYLKRYDRVQRISVDSGYESEENYCYSEQHPGIEVEWILLSIAFDLLKLLHKMQKQRLGTGLCSCWILGRIVTLWN